MAAIKPKDSLDLLQFAVNDVLVQAGRAIKGASRDAAKAEGQPTTNLRPKLESTCRVFHAALDDLECEIIASKSVLMRDLTVLRHKKAAAAAAAAAAAPNQATAPPKQAPAAPMVVDLESPKLIAGSINKQQQHQAATMAKANSNNGIQPKRESKPAAPFPDMGMSMGMGMGMEDTSTATSIDLAGRSTKAEKPASPKPPAKGTPKPAHFVPPWPQVAHAKARVAPMGIGPAAPGAAPTNPKTPLVPTTTSGPEGGPTLPFTDIELSLAPSSDPPESTAASSVPGTGPGAGAAPTASMGDMSAFNISVPLQQLQQLQQPNLKNPAVAPAPMGGGSVSASTTSNPVTAAAPGDLRAAGLQSLAAATRKPAPPPPPPPQTSMHGPPPAAPAVDDMYTLGDLDTDMGGSRLGVTDTNFDDMFLGGSSYDNAYFGGE